MIAYNFKANHSDHTINLSYDGVQHEWQVNTDKNVPVRIDGGVGHVRTLKAAQTEAHSWFHAQHGAKCDGDLVWQNLGTDSHACPTCSNPVLDTSNRADGGGAVSCRDCGWEIEFSREEVDAYGKK
ncbi:MAG: hypothetical protein M3P27_05410 [Acidobacteriota bacterium]|nr:hypothetical protein [Acidobacteriota bacterium]